MTLWTSSVRLGCACLLGALTIGMAVNSGKAASAADQPEKKGKLSIGVTANDDPAEQIPKPAVPASRRRGDDDDEMPAAMTPGLPTTSPATVAPPGQAGRSGRPVQTGGPAQSTFPAGSADDALYRFCIALADGDTATASDYVSHSAIGVAAKLREGELPEARIEEISESLKPFEQLQNVQARRPSNIKRSVRNQRSGQVISFVLKKEKEIYKIVEVSVSKAKEGKDAADTRDRS